MRNENYIQVLFLFTILFIVSGCGGGFKVRTATPEQSQHYKTLSPPEGKGQIYIFNAKGWYGRRRGILVFIDGNQVGLLARKTFFCENLEPGNHNVTANLVDEKVHSYWKSVKTGKIVKPGIYIKRTWGAIKKQESFAFNLSVNQIRFFKLTEDSFGGVVSIEEIRADEAKIYLESYILSIDKPGGNPWELK